MASSAITHDDVRNAFARIEDELIASMTRNLSRHRAEELEEGFDWAQWQALQLESLDAYVRENAHRYGPVFDSVNARMEDAIREAYADGGAKAEAGILAAIRRGWEPPAHHGGTFFSVNTRRLDALIAATHSDMMRAEHAVLRKAADEYRKVVFDAQVYAASGAGTYEKAIDMATDDLLRRGITSVTYSNGAVHKASEYAAMAVRTAVKRATFAGDGQMRAEWGVHTVVVNNRTNACPDCMEWCGQVLVDDVYSEGTSKEADEGGYVLLSEAMDAGLFHPNCQDTMSTWFPDVSEKPKKASRKQKEDAEERESLEAAETAAESNSERYRRLSEYSLDDTKRERYAELADEWANKKAAVSTKISGALSGAIRGEDWDSIQKMDAHAERYYKEILARDRQALVSRIAIGGEINEDEATEAFEHLFVRKHLLDGEMKPFDPDYDIAQSVQRILEGKVVYEHDRILLKHEALEAKLMKSGLSYEAAHARANRDYNYQQALKRWLKEGSENA